MSSAPDDVGAGSTWPSSILLTVLRGILRRPWKVMIVDDQRRWRGIHIVVGALFVASVIARRTSQRRVGVMVPTSGMFPVVTIATWLLGRTVVPLNYLLRPDDLAYVIDDAELDLVVTVRPMLERFGELPPRVSPLFLEDVSRRAIPRPRLPKRRRSRSTAVLIYTSGTSGRPKGVELSSAAIAANVGQCAEWGRVTNRDTFLGVLPQFHCFGLTVLTLLPLAVGGRVVYTARFVPRRLFELIREHRPTGFVGVPAMYRALLADRSASSDDFRSFRYLICGGEPLPPELRAQFEERFGLGINQGYGLTETGPVINWNRPEDGQALSVGRALPGVEERIVDAQGRQLPAGQEGEIIVRGPNLMTRYFKLPVVTAGAIDAAGFFHTGDLGRIDADGYLTITGRMSDLIIIAGENVFPTEIEDVLNAHPEIKESAVVGVSDPSRGQVPIAFVLSEEGTAVDEASIRAFCRDHLAGYKVPRRVLAVDELPRSATGKVLRHALLKLAGETIDEHAASVDDAPAQTDGPNRGDRE